MGGTGRFAGMYVLLAALGIAVVLNMSTTGLGAVNSALHKAKESGPGRWVASTWEQHAPAVQASLQRAKDSEAGQWVASLVERYIPSAHELLMSFSLGNVNLATGGAMPPPGRSRQAGECKVEAGVEPDAQTEKGAEEAQRLEVVKAEGAAEACSCGVRAFFLPEV